MKYFIAVGLLFLFMQTGKAQDKNEMQADIALIKKNLAESKEKIKGYEWIETTTLFLKG